jgi:glycosyltransferase involved in cell wall biosynthesis
MHWVLAAPFISEVREHPWLTRYVPQERHQFTVVPARGAPGRWHHRMEKNTPLREWRLTWDHAGRALAEAHGGIITCFPQLAAAVGLRQRIRFGRRRHLAWSFNLGQIYSGAKKRIARIALANVDCFVVHSRREIDQYSAWLRLPRERFEFVPIQRAPVEVIETEARDEPFVLAMGSAARDYRTLVSAVKKLNLRTIIVAAPHAIDGIELPANVTVQSKLSASECHALAQRARVNVVPVDNDQTASGQVTVVEAMTMGRPLVATRCMGTEDYIASGENGLLVSPQSIQEMASAIERLWQDDTLREHLGGNAREYARSHFSDEAVGASLTRILDALQQ